MRGFLLGMTIAVTLLVRPPAYAQDLAFDTFGDHLESLRVQAGIPGVSAAVVGRSDILWERAFGRQDVEQAIATRSDTPFHLDGMTQAVTASLVLRCVEEGRLFLDDRVGQFTLRAPTGKRPYVTSSHTQALVLMAWSMRTDRSGSRRCARQ